MSADYGFPGSCDARVGAGFYCQKPAKGTENITLTTPLLFYAHLFPWESFILLNSNTRLNGFWNKYWKDLRCFLRQSSFSVCYLDAPSYLGGTVGAEKSGEEFFTDLPRERRVRTGAQKTTLLYLPQSTAESFLKRWAYQPICTIPCLRKRHKPPRGFLFWKKLIFYKK